MAGRALDERWQAAFWKTVRRHRNASPLREAALRGSLGDWTAALTSVAIAACEELGWRASAKGHLLDLLPVPRGEYLAMDLTAFAEGEKRWCFPTAVMEFENRREEDFIAYSLWKVLCVRSELRVVFCYRDRAEDAPRLIHLLRDEVVRAMDLQRRAQLEGSTVVMVGTRGEAETFPNGFFRWWRLDPNTASFYPMG